MRTTPQWTEFRHYPATTGTMLLAVLATLWWWTGGSIDMLEENAMLSRGQVWRLLTSALPHVDVLHLIFNLYWCWVFGTLVEGIFGSVRTLGMLALFAVGSGAADYAFLDGGVGLSGVGYGLFGLLWVLSRRDPRFADALSPSTVVMFVGWFVFCIVTTYTQVMPVANVAHGMGALLGALVGYAISSPQHRQAVSVISTVMVVLCVLGATVLRPWTNLSAAAGQDAASRGYAALMAQHNEEAADWYSYAARLSPHEATNWYDLGLTKAAKGDIDGALADFSKATELKADFAEAWHARGSAKYRKGDFDGAMADYSKAIALKSDYAEAYYGCASVKYRKGDLEGALTDYTTVIELEPDDADAYINRGTVKGDKGDLDGALADYSKAIAIKADCAEAYYGRGSVRYRKDDLDGAVADFNRAADLKPDYVAAYCYRGLAKKDRGDLEGALADYSKVIELEPKNAWAYQSRGYLRYDRQAWAEALADFRKAVELKPSDEYARFRVWLVRARLGEAAATTELQDYLKTRRGKAEDWAGKVGGFLAGQMTEAEFLKAAESADAKADREQHCEAYFCVGTRRLLEGDKVAAMDYFEKCVGTGQQEFTEYRSAEAELKVLKAER